MWGHWTDLMGHVDLSNGTSCFALVAVGQGRCWLASALISNEIT